MTTRTAPSIDGKTVRCQASITAMSPLARAVLALVLVVLARPGFTSPADTPAPSPCYARFEGVPHDRRNYTILCRDGDPQCDADGRADRACTFRVMVCAQGSGEGCGQHGSLPLRLIGARLQLPKRHPHARACGRAVDIHVRLGERFLHLFTGKRLHPHTFDRLDLHCLPCT